MERKFLCGVLLFLTLLYASLGEEMVVNEGPADGGRVCSTPSLNYRGPCFIDRNCESVCKLEGFPDGYCDVLTRRCLCAKPCP
uniref:Knottins-like domain-containing protein n=1 Tax=Nelumbo nucifera TaxID=4432 RepID=A0A822ZHE5_NELNU|nr:TPA_asm: hypothetical protein HUJ06_002160 [Nelumbo nucifera]